MLFVAGALAGCATMSPQDFASSPTHFELDRYFTGHTRSWGVFESGGGAPRRYFTADSVGRRDGRGTLTLTQHFAYSDGKTQMRIWKIRRVNATHWDATANDMIGTAHGECEGNSLYWEYTITVDRKNPLATVHVRQWIYQPEHTDVIMTRLVVTKLGVSLFQVSETIHHVPGE